MMVVLKFGGTSVGEIESFRRVLADLCGHRLAFTAHDVADLEALRESLSRIAEIRVVEGLATVTLVGDGLPDDPRLQADAARELRDLPVHLMARAAGRRTLSFVVDAAHTGAVMSRHDRFFGTRRRPAAASTPLVQA